MSKSSRVLGPLERLALSIILALAAVDACLAQAPTLPRATPYVYAIRRAGVVSLLPGEVVALVLAPSDTVFVQAVGANTVALWSGRVLAGMTGVTLHRGESVPGPDAVPVLCAHGGEVCIIFTARDGPELVNGVVYRPTARS